MTPYHYIESGLDTIYLLNGVHTIEEDGDTFTSINDIEQLHLQIAKALINKHSPLQAKEFKFLRVELNLSQKALAELLGVDSQTVARWEKGETAIPRGSDVLLRAYYLESQAEDSKIGLMLKTLAEAETTEVMTRIEFEEQDHRWIRAVA
jgi:DNA-binding transcriptional regulator YiaG